jgi:MarR family transcriptional regulator, organic hydroperoxide resistance regulator
VDNMKKNKINNIEYLLRKICFTIKKKGRTILEEFGITPPQFDALQYLVNDGNLTIGELSSRLYLAPSTITDLVDRMEKNNLVERIKSGEDRRVVKVRVVDKGLLLIDKVISLRCQFIESSMGEFSEKDMEEFIKHLELINKSSLCIESKEK